MAAIRFKEVQRFILAKKNILGLGALRSPWCTLSRLWVLFLTFNSSRETVERQGNSTTTQYFGGVCLVYQLLRSYTILSTSEKNLIKEKTVRSLVCSSSLFYHRQSLMVNSNGIETPG